ncbi:MAG: hypothetical protein K0B14_13475 [Anaerolineaceae bacterium]|nr:hypothetical protein [Anaerolineaceae bacterium]
MTLKAEIMDTTKISSNFPLPPEQEIIRDSFLETIEKLFSNQPMVIVEGEVGIGKTTLLSQFARRFPENSISVFITPATRASYDPDTIRIDLLSQVFWILTRKELSYTDFETMDITSDWGKRRNQLLKFSKSRYQTFYFVLDGICEIPDNHSFYRDLIFDMLPFGFYNDFKFLISGNPKNIPCQILEQINYKSFPIPAFTLEESERYLSELGFSNDDLIEIYRIHKTPGSLASIRRSIHGENSKNEFLKNLPLELANLLDLEWKNIDFNNEVLTSSLALIAYSPKELSIKDVSNVLKDDEDQIYNLLTQVQFITIIDYDKVTFVSEDQLSNAQSKLSDFKEAAEKEIIKFLKNSNDPSAPIDLSSFFESTNRHRDLIQFSTPDTLVKILKSSQSLIPLFETTMKCVKSAQKLDRDLDVIDFGLQTAVINELFSTATGESEINALISLNETDAALALIERASTKEDQLLLLSVLANANIKYDLRIQGLDERIKTIYQQVDKNMLENKALDIATNLINFLPEIAFDLVENSMKIDASEQGLDWAFTKLSMRAMAKSEYDKNAYDILEKIMNKIKDPDAKNFLTTGSLLFFNFSAEEVISQVNNFDQVRDQFYILRSWASKNREVDNVGSVLEYALQIAISSTEFSPNARDFRQLSSPLPYISDLDLRKKLINKIDAQRSTIEKLGPIEDYVRIFVILGIAENDFDSKASINRFIEAFLYSQDLEEIATKSSCLVRILNGLLIIDPNKELEYLHIEIEEELKNSVEAILMDSAEQYVVTKNIIRALAVNRTEYAFEISSKLNGEDRRNQAYRDVVKDLLDVPDNKLDFSLIQLGYKNISNKALCDSLLLYILDRINSIENPAIMSDGRILYFINGVFNLLDASDRSSAVCVCLEILEKMKETKDAGLKNKLFEILKSSWNDIDVEWLKIDMGFKIVEATSNNQELAYEILSIVEQYRNTVQLETREVALTYLATIRLCLRAYSGLIFKRIDTADDYLQIVNLINNVHSYSEKIGLYTDLALKFWSIDRLDDFSRVVKEKIKPLINSFYFDDGLAYQAALIEASPALYLHHSISTIDKLKAIEAIEVRDKAFNSICSFIITKRYNEPFFDPGKIKGEKLSYDEIIDLIKIINEIDRDAFVFHLISEISESVINYKNGFTKNERAEIARKLEELIERKLPNDKYIKHDGFKLTSLAKVYKIKNVNISEWKDLISRTKSINIADQVFILAYIADSLPNSYYKLRDQLINDAVDLINCIPSDYDRINRYELLSQISLNDRNLAQKLLRAGMELLVKKDDPDYLSTQRRFIDLAYKIDTNFAAELASVADDDPARSKSKYNLQNRLTVQNLKKETISTTNSSEFDIDLSKDDYSSTAWILLGSLNANRIHAQRFDKMRKFEFMGASIPLLDGYPIFAWLFQNCVVNYKNKPQASDYIRPLFNATLKASDLIINIAQKSNLQIQKAKSTAIDKMLTSTTMEDLSPDDAKLVLKNWLSSSIKDELFIADAYFGREELWILHEVVNTNPNCKVYILTSKKHNNKLTQPQKEYTDYWRREISDHEPPPTEVVIAGLETDQLSPIHDRWWISGNSGIRIGTSSNSLAGSKISEISNFSPADAEKNENTIKRFAIYKDRAYKGVKINYMSFTL